MDRMGAAVIGAGIYGEVHVRTYKSDPRIELVSIWSRSTERAEKIGKKYNCGYTTDLQEIASDDRIDIVSVATPDFAHTEAALKMLRAGKHVLLEKPMATSVEECRQILDTYNQQRSVDPKLKLMVNFHNRWYPPVAKAKQVIDKGEIGTPVTVYAKLSDRIEVATEWLSWAGQSGPEWFLLPHTIDIARWLIGKQKVKSVFALGKKGVLLSRGIDCYDAVQVQIEFEDTIASFESSWIVPSSWRNIIEFQIDVLGSAGKVAIAGDAEGIEIVTKRFDSPFIYDWITEEEPIKYFIDCVINDKLPEATGEDGLAVTQIIAAVVESLQSGKVVHLTV